MLVLASPHRRLDRAGAGFGLRHPRPRAGGGTIARGRGRSHRVWHPERRVAGVLGHDEGKHWGSKDGLLDAFAGRGWVAQRWSGAGSVGSARKGLARLGRSTQQAAWALKVLPAPASVLFHCPVEPLVWIAGPMSHRKASHCGMPLLLPPAAACRASRWPRSMGHQQHQYHDREHRQGGRRRA